MKWLIVCLVALCGCSAKTSPIEDVTAPAIKTVEEALDYAKNNIEETEDTRLLTANLEACHGALISCETVGKQALKSKEEELRSHKLLIIIAAILAFVFGRTIRV